MASDTLITDTKDRLDNGRVETDEALRQVLLYLEEAQSKRDLLMRTCDEQSKKIDKCLEHVTQLHTAIDEIHNDLSRVTKRVDVIEASKIKELESNEDALKKRIETLEHKFKFMTVTLPGIVFKVLTYIGFAAMAIYWIIGHINVDKGKINIDTQESVKLEAPAKDK